MDALFENLDKEQARTYALVLSAENIACEIAPGLIGWNLRVGSEQRERARNAIAAYLAENEINRKSDAEPREDYRRTFTGLWVALVLAATHLLVTLAADDRWIVNRYGASAEEILKGQYYRCATALMLHLDSVHLAGNMAGIALFGTAVCSVTGWGAGWLIILASGLIGNLLAAFFYQTDHLSIGASTAVFGAVGFMAIHQFAKRWRAPGRRLRAWIPLGGGLALLALLGASPQGDLAAHLFGFAGGLLVGLFYALMARRPLADRLQPICLLSAAGVLALCWLAGA